MTIKSVEVYYTVASIPGIASGDMGAALDFRNAAMHLVETALVRAKAGEWEGAEIGANLWTGELEVNFGFSVEDFAKAEAVIQKAVEGTDFANIREIVRNEIDPADFV